MSNNSYGSHRGGGSNFGGQQRNQNQNNYNNGNRSQGSGKKKSGAKFGMQKNDSGLPYVHGWMVRARTGMITFTCIPYKGTDVHTSQSGNKWHNWMVKVKYVDQIREDTFSCLYNPSNHTCHIKDLGLIVSPKSPNGGWVGNPGANYK